MNISEKKTLAEEPVAASSAAVLALGPAVVAVLVAFGLNVPTTAGAAISAVVGVLLSLYARSKVTPTAKVDAVVATALAERETEIHDYLVAPNVFEPDGP